MTTSGTYLYNPSIADLFLEAFGRINIFGAQITRDHIFHARRSTNLMFVAWANRGIALWAIDLQTISLAAGQATYTVDPATIAVLDVYYSQVNGGGVGVNADRIMTPMSRTEYAEIPNKLQTGTPTRYWFEKLAVETPAGGALSGPTMTIWQPALPSQIAPNFVINFYRFRRMQDAVPQMGQQPDIHYRFLDAFAAELAVRLAQKFKPELLANPNNSLERSKKETWDEAVETDQEDAPLTITPMLGGYWRR